MLALVPGDRHRLEGGIGLPPGVRDHGDGVVADLDDLLHARHGHRLGGVEARDLAAEHGGSLDRSVQHAGQLDVRAIDLLAVELVDRVEPLHRLAGDGPVLRILEGDVLRRLDLRRRLGHLAVGRAASGGRMRDHALGDLAVRRRHAQPFAAACTSMMRAAAPPSRTYCSDSRMPRLPPVEKFRQTRLRATFWPVSDIPRSPWTSHIPVPRRRAGRDRSACPGPSPSGRCGPPPCRRFSRRPRH